MPATPTGTPPTRPTSAGTRASRAPRRLPPSTKDVAATTNTHELTVAVDVAAVIPASHRMWPTTNPPIPATQIAALKS